METILTILLGALLFRWGMRFGRLMLRKGATANDLFKGKASVSLAFLGLYFSLLLLALYVPQFQGLPLEWRVYGMRVTWTILRVTLLGFCGVAFMVSWKTARSQVVAVALIGLIGLGGFTAAETYFLAPIYASLNDNLQPNGVFRQTSNSSCAPAALATVLRLWDFDATESEVARFAGTSRLGTSMPQLIVAAQAMGMDGVELFPTWEQMQQVNRPGVLATWLYSETGRAPHAVALIGLKDNTATIADPAFGRIFQIDRTQFERIWRKEYVPIFRPEEGGLIQSQATDYLRQLGFLNRPSDSLNAAVQRFQQASGLRVNGELDAPTVLLLSGPFLSQVPTLEHRGT
ncbi:peptidoglycan-binding protein [Oculatella sp. LEGE 06141]|nr:peptidoglycan-binding protein [Oculatella sp. LEGE 06141]